MRRRVRDATGRGYGKMGASDASAEAREDAPGDLRTGQERAPRTDSNRQYPRSVLDWYLEVG